MTADDIYKNRYRFFSVAALGTFLSTLDGSILFVALPTLAEQLHVPVDIVAWVSISYSLTLISLMLVFGAWTKNKGYQFSYKFGFTLFFIGSLLSGLSVNIYQLIGARIIQAVGGAMFQAVGPGLITTVFPKEERGKGIGLVVMMVSIGFMVGPPLGGFLLSIWPWSSLFLINLPICVVGYILTHRIFRILAKPHQHGRVHVVSGAALGLALTSAMAAMTLMNDVGILDWRVLSLVAAAAVLVVVFVKYESNPDTALIGFSIFKNKQFTTSLVAMSTQFIAMAGTQVLIPFYLQEVKGLETLQTGLYLVIPPIMLMIFAPLSGKLSDKIGYRFLTSFGVIVYIIGLILLSQLSVDTSGAYLAMSLVVIGAGAGIFGTPNASAFMGSVSDKERPVASSILSSTRNIGLSSGIAISTALFAWLQIRYSQSLPAHEAFTAAYDKIIYFSIAIALLGLPFCLGRENRNVY